MEEREQKKSGWRRSPEEMTGELDKCVYYVVIPQVREVKPFFMLSEEL